jgi:hypothetical protein
MPKGTSLYAPTETGDRLRELAARAGVGTGRFIEALVNWHGVATADSLIRFGQMVKDGPRRE